MKTFILENLRTSFPSKEAQEKQLNTLVEAFGALPDSAVKNFIVDILCLSKLIFEAGNTNIVRNMRIKSIELESEEDAGLKYQYLSACLTSFKPAILKRLEEHFSEKYHLDPQLVTCLPKTEGKQMGAKVVVKKDMADKQPLIFLCQNSPRICV